MQLYDCRQLWINVNVVCVLCSKQSCYFCLLSDFSACRVTLRQRCDCSCTNVLALFETQLLPDVTAIVYVHVMYRASCICICICISLTYMYVNKLSLWKVLNITGISRWVLVVIVFILCWSSELCTYWILLYFVLFSMCRPLCWFGRRVRIWPTYLLCS